MLFPFRPRRPGFGLAALSAVFAVALAAPARGEMVTSTFDNVSPGQVVTIYDSASVANGESGWAGQYNFSSATGGYLSGPYGGFCIDIGQDIYGGVRTTFNVADLSNAPVPGAAMGPQRAELIEELWFNDYASALTANNGNTAAENAAAFQIAIWEIINEGVGALTNISQLNVFTGSIQVSGDTSTLNRANLWLSGLELDGNGNKANLVALTNSTYQDYVVQAPTTAAPAPSGLVLGGIAAVSGGLAAGWRRYRRPARGLTA